MTKNAGYSPGRVIRLKHLHTSEVERIREIEKREEGKVLYEVRLTGKARPMLLLWSSKSGTLYVLKMTTKAKNYRKKYLVTIRDASYVDCERIYEYNEVVIDRKEEIIDFAVWKCVKDLMRGLHPLVAEIMVDRPALLELRQGFSI